MQNDYIKDPEREENQGLDEPEMESSVCLWEGDREELTPEGMSVSLWGRDGTDAAPVLVAIRDGRGKEQILLQLLRGAALATSRFQLRETDFNLRPPEQWEKKYFCCFKSPGF